MTRKRYWGMAFLMIWFWHLNAAFADDSEILGDGRLLVEPNVLILLDTSISMDTQDVPETPYHWQTDYSESDSGFDRHSFYYGADGKDGGRWFAVNLPSELDAACQRDLSMSDLLVNGHARVRVRLQAPHDCGDQYPEIDLRTGNFLNYENGGNSGPLQKRLDAVGTAIKKLIDDHPDVRFGLMCFPQKASGAEADVGMGARLSDHGDIGRDYSPAELKADLDGITASGYSPLAEALAEAGLYFAGKTSWFNPIRYTSPIDKKCRTNVIILVTDGAPTKDQDQRLRQTGAYINNGTIGDYDRDGRDPGRYDADGSDYLDDVALFLYENDLMPVMGAGDPLFEKQNIITHIIGFKYHHTLLNEAAKNGSGFCYVANSVGSLSSAFEKILSSIEDGYRQVQVAPSVQMGRSKRVYAGEYLYQAMFTSASGSGRWRGNLKKYKVDDDGRILDQNDRIATDADGKLLSSARSFWSAGNDGAKVDLGGAGALLVKRSNRRLFTYAGIDKDLAAGVNEFTLSNRGNIGLKALNVTTEEQRVAVINTVRGNGQAWVMGDILRWEPKVVAYDTNGNGRIEKKDDALIFVGTNGGVVHAFLDSTGEELWGFIPPMQLGRLKLLANPGRTHPYFVDGTPEIIQYKHKQAVKTALVFGEGRGGRHYYALDITAHDQPEWMFAIGEQVLGNDAEPLGQSWGRPQLATIAAGRGKTEDVLLIPGGYDTNQDSEEPRKNDARGRAVFSVAVDSGDPGRFCFDHMSGNPDMTHCIVDMTGVDTTGDGITNSIYAPDLGGRMFYFTDADKDGVWQKHRLFDASTETHRKIFYAPDVVRITGDPNPRDILEEVVMGEMVFFGTGDRAHPRVARIANRFYAVKNFWRGKRFNTLTDQLEGGGNGDLHDATKNPILQAPNMAVREKAAGEIKARMGWFIELEAPGEKVVSSPIVYNRTVYFTTYVPLAHETESEDSECGAEAGAGEARLYGLNYLDARAVHADWSDVKEYDPVTREEIHTGGKADRYKVIGTAMPSQPMIAIRDGNVLLYVGVGGKIIALTPEPAVEMNMYYWREMSSLKGH